MSQQIVCDVHGGQMLLGEDYWTVTRYSGGELNICARCGTSGSTISAWVSLAPYTAGRMVHAVAGIGEYVYEVTVGGTAGAVQPVWPTALGGTVVDGDVTWVARPAPLNLVSVTVPLAEPTPDVATTFLGWWLRVLEPAHPNASQPR